MNTRYALVLAFAVLSCKSAPEVVPDAELPTLPQQELEVVSQSLTNCDLKLTATVAATTESLVVEKALWEFVVEGEVRRSGEQALGVSVAAGGTADIALEQTLTYVRDAEDLKAMDTRGGSLLAALRGNLVIQDTRAAAGSAPAATRTLQVPFARGREVRTPRLPHLKMMELEAGRFDDSDVQVLFHLGVVNPNPFYVSITGVTYEIELAGKQVAKGRLGAGDKVSPASTGVFDVETHVAEATHGPEAKKLIKGLILPYVVKAQLTAELYEEPFEARGEVKLNKPR